VVERVRVGCFVFALVMVAFYPLCIFLGSIGFVICMLHAKEI
jgi:hypothetical protein